MYKLKIHRQVSKRFKKLSPKQYKRISKTLHKLAQKGQTSQTKKLSGKHKGSYRLRIGNWRILFTKDEGSKTIHLLYFDTRGDAY